MSRVKKLIWFIALPTAFVLINALFITCDGLNDDINSSSVAIILGNKVNEDGSPHPRLQARLDRGLKLYQQGTVPKLIVSGGLGKEGHYEGDVMADYLMNAGVKPEDIIIDNVGINTHASAINYAQLQEKHGFNSVIIVSQFFHISRSRLAFKQAGVKIIYTAHAYYVEPRDIYSTLREVPGYYAYLLKY